MFRKGLVEEVEKILQAIEVGEGRERILYAGKARKEKMMSVKKHRLELV